MTYVLFQSMVFRLACFRRFLFAHIVSWTLECILEAKTVEDIWKKEGIRPNPLSS